MTMKRIIYNTSDCPLAVHMILVVSSAFHCTTSSCVRVSTSRRNKWSLYTIKPHN